MNIHGPARFSSCQRPSKTDRFHLAHQADASGDCSVSLSLSLSVCLPLLPSYPPSLPRSLSPDCSDQLITLYNTSARLMHELYISCMWRPLFRVTSFYLLPARCCARRNNLRSNWVDFCSSLGGWVGGRSRSNIINNTGSQCIEVSDSSEYLRNGLLGLKMRKNMCSWGVSHGTYGRETESV